MYIKRLTTFLFVVFILPSLFFTAGALKMFAACSTGGSNSAICNTGNIQNLNFGINNISPWFQGIGGDMRLDAGFKNILPSANSYASIPSSGLTRPGVLFSGDQTPSFGLGQGAQNPYNWVVGGLSNPEVFTPAHGSLIRTSYDYMQATAKQTGLVPGALTASHGNCTDAVNGCDLNNLSQGLWQDTTTQDFYLAATTFCGDNGNCKDKGTNSAGKWVILLSGNLHILGRILTPPGYSLTFSVKGNIYVDKGLGETASTTCSQTTGVGCDIEGFYSTDKSFIASGINNCAIGPDLRLNVAGVVVTNAAYTGGSFQNQRDLCTNDSYPSFTVSERADFILNAPAFLRHPNTIWQEVAP